MIIFFFSNDDSSSSRGEDDGHDETEQADSLGEDENQNHANEELGLDCVHAHADVSHYTDGEAGGLNIHVSLICV